MRQLQIALFAVLLSWSIDVDAQGSTGPRVTPEELTSIRSLIGGTTQFNMAGNLFTDNFVRGTTVQIAGALN